jgi:hypothetical protein
MSHGLFDVFSKMISGLPARAVPKALDLQCRMIEEDGENRRLASPEDACSILCFRQFIQSTKLGQPMENLKPLSPDHIEFYKETIVRLIQSEVLPPSAMDRFDAIFVRPGFQ